MIRRTLCALLCALSLPVFFSCDSGTGGGPDDGSSSRIIDHTDSSIDGLTDASVNFAKETLDIVYWHTSHGSQLVTGMDGMDAFYGNSGLYTTSPAPSAGELKLVDSYTQDLGNPGLPEFEATTRDWLGLHPETNVVMWSWCGQVAHSDEATIADYLARMSDLESDFPAVSFVYMTGHAFGSSWGGTRENLAARNGQIRAYCRNNGKYLYDFNDIESYDPDGTWFGDRFVTDECNYGTAEDVFTGNWASEWQAANPGLWWDCESAHSLPVNANMKARAAWHLFARIAADRAGAD